MSLPTFRPRTAPVRRERLASGRVPPVRLPNTWYPAVKVTADFVLALVLTIVALPVMAVSPWS